MKEQEQIKQMENMLRRTRLHAPINPEHKNRLRKQLFSGTKSRPRPFFSVHIGFAVTAVLAVIGLYSLYTPVTPSAVGTVIWHSDSELIEGVDEKGAYHIGEDIYSGRMYHTGDQIVTLVLDDGSRLQFLRQSAFAIQASSTDRLHDDSIIQLKRGTLKASVMKSLDHSMIVKTPDVEVKVVGTEFIVRVY